MTRARRTIAAGASLAVIAAAVIVVTAGGTPGADEESGAAKTYLGARDAFELKVAAGLPEARAAVDRVREAVRAECGDALRGAPREGRVVEEGYAGGGRVRLSTRTLLLGDIMRNVEAAVEASRGSATSRFADSIEGLPWGDRRIAAVVHDFATFELVKQQESGRDLCPAVREWARSGFRRVPRGLEPGESSVEMAGRRLSAALVDVGCQTTDPARAILRLLKRDNGGAVSEQVERHERTLAAAEGRILDEATSAIEKTLGLATEHASRRPLGESGASQVQMCTGRD